MTDSPTDQTPLAFQVVTEITIISHLAQTLTERRLPDGLSWAQFGVLNHFQRLGGTAEPAGLAAAFQVTKGAMTHTLGRLEAQGLVTVRPHGADGRRKVVAITAAGLEAHAESLRRLGPDLARLRAALGAEGFAEALPFLRRMREWFDAER